MSSVASTFARLPCGNTRSCLFALFSCDNSSFNDSSYLARPEWQAALEINLKQ